MQGSRRKKWPKKNCFNVLFFIFVFSLVAILAAEELPRPTYQNAVIISIEHPVEDEVEVNYIKNNFSFGLYAWLSFSRTALVPVLSWHARLDDASNGIQSFKDTVKSMMEKARQKNVRLHLVLCSGLARGLYAFREAKEEDIRNCQWYNDNKLASDSQILDPYFLDRYVFGTLSRYARKMRANLEAKSKAALAFLKQMMDFYPETLIAISGWGEAELNFGRIDESKSLQDWFCDYSPFAILEFRDWICHTGLYDDTNGIYKGQGYIGGGVRYQGEAGLSRFNADFGTDFTTWDLKYFNWSLNDDYDNIPEDYFNPDLHRIALSSYIHGGMIPDSGPDYIPGGFDPPRVMQPGNKFWDLWHLFRETMVANFVKDLAKWAYEVGIPPERWFSHQIPGDYLFGTNPSVFNKNGRYWTGASPLWTADISPYGSAGATMYDIKFPGWLARTTEYAVPAISAMSSNWAVMEYDAETYPIGYSVSQSDVDFILQQYLRLYNYRVHLINFYQWVDNSGEHRIKGMNKEEALRQFIQKIRDKARNTDLSVVYDPPKVPDLSVSFLYERSAVQIKTSGRIWADEPWLWKDWGDFSHFEVHRSTTPNFSPDARTHLATITEYSFIDTSACPGGVYYYKIRAINRKGIGGSFSDEVMVAVPTTGLAILSVNKKNFFFGAEEGKAATGGESLIIFNSGPPGTILNWTASSQADWLKVYPASGLGNARLSISVDHTKLTAGKYSSSIIIQASAALNSPQLVDVTLTVYGAGQDGEPFGCFDTPLEGAHVFGSVPVTGWALDDIEVVRVEIKRAAHPLDDPVVVGADGLVYIGDGVFVRGARPDVASLYSGYPRADRAGWGYMMLTNFLPNQGNGVFTLYVFAYDTSGHRKLLGAKTIYCDNASATLPFGTIDTPGQGAVVSGSNYVNFGWALTPRPKYIPRDGSTIWVWIDSQPVGHPVYNQYRADIAGLFPGYANSDGAVGYYYIDTTRLENGTHTIVWGVTDSAGETSGIGSRYFEVENVGVGLGKRFEGMRYEEDRSGGLRLEVEGGEEVEVEELGMVEVRLRGRGGSRCIGWGEEEGEPLPVGSSLDEARGVFRWIVGPGFLGRHVLHFAVTDGQKRSPAVKVSINIVPRRFFQSNKSFLVPESANR
jgi:hypothetical protein